MKNNEYFFKVCEIKDKLVTIDRNIINGTIVGLFLRDSIRFYNFNPNYSIPINNKDLVDRKRAIYSHRMDFDVKENKLLLSVPKSNPYFKTYKIGNKIIYVSNENFFDIVEYDYLDKYLESLELDSNLSKTIKKEKSLILTSDVPTNIVNLRSRKNI